MSDGFKLAGAAVAIVILGVLGIVVFSAIWLRIGLGAALVVVCGGLLLFAWRVDRKERAQRSGLDRI